METGGFKGRTRIVTRDDLYARTSALLGIPRDKIVAEYGMTELTSQYYDVNATTRAKSGPPWLRARVVGPDRKRCLTVRRAPCCTSISPIARRASRCKPTISAYAKTMVSFCSGAIGKPSLAAARWMLKICANAPRFD